MYISLASREFDPKKDLTKTDYKCCTAREVENFCAPAMDPPPKAHRPAQAGAKAEKKGKGKKHEKGFNEKARCFCLVCDQ